MPDIHAHLLPGERVPGTAAEIAFEVVRYGEDAGDAIGGGECFGEKLRPTAPD